MTFKLGDSNLPTSPVEGGSWTAATIGSAVKVACDAVGEKLFNLAQEMDDVAFRPMRALKDVTIRRRAD
ncbi:MAG: hypothetical protein WKF84_14160 [Pyrinomonadaceae bacterium]